MMHYKKGKNIEEELSKEQIPIENLPDQFLWMHVKGGSRIFNLTDYAKKALETGEYRSMVWSGSGGGIGKTISCAEIMRRDLELHQVTRICYRKVEEYWDPQQEGLEPIVATRNIPSIHILMSLDEIDPKSPGYQHSKTRTMFWLEGDHEGKIGGNRKGGNYFTGPQLKKKPNKHYGDDKHLTKNVNQGAMGGNSNNNKNKNKNKNNSRKTASEVGTGDKQKQDASISGENKPKKAKNSDKKEKAEASGEKLAEKNLSAEASASDV